MSGQDPVCHIPPVNQIRQPDPVALPAIPPAQENLKSLVHTVNVMRQVIHRLTGQHPAQGPRGYEGGRGQPGQGGPRGGAGALAPSGSWKQKQVVTETIRVYNPNDHEQYVDVKRINKLVMGNDITKQVWEYDRKD